MSNFLIIGPLTLDTIVRDKKTYRSTGGAVYYQAAVLSRMGVNTTAVVTLSREDEHLLESFPDDVDFVPVFVDKTLKFENIYPNHDPNHRIQNADVTRNPIKPENLRSIDLKEFDALLISALTPFDVPLETVEYLSKSNVPIYAGIQGYLRHIKENKVILKPWNDFKKFLKFFDVVFLDEVEARVVLGTHIHKLEDVARTISNFGPNEVVITRGGRGSIIYSVKTGGSYRIPAFPHKLRVDPTGLGDTYMAAYATRRMETLNPETCGIFASMVSTMKLEGEGTFDGTRTLVESRISEEDTINKNSF
ncbi:PfkB family carbohydrate kinase [Methanobacterium aggregans]|uniref:PfkB family carbohydrate kinase n=1 Tax=Methanobacterium aggregans TaxID=1615586 RepID=UPI00320E4AB5